MQPSAKLTRVLAFALFGTAAQILHAAAGHAVSACRGGAAAPSRSRSRPVGEPRRDPGVDAVHDHQYRCRGHPLSTPCGAPGVGRVDAIPDVANVERYARIVKEKSTLRRLNGHGEQRHARGTRRAEHVVLREALEADDAEHE